MTLAIILIILNFLASMVWLFLVTHTYGQKWVDFGKYETIKPPLRLWWVFIDLCTIILPIIGFLVTLIFILVYVDFWNSYRDVEFRGIPKWLKNLNENLNA